METAAFNYKEPRIDPSFQIDEAQIPEATMPEIKDKKYILVLDAENEQVEFEKYMKLVEFIMKDYNLTSSGLIIKGNMEYEEKAL